MSENKMRSIRIEKVVLSAGALGESLDKSVRLLEIITKRKAMKTKARSRIPTWNIRPGLEVGCKVTLRGKEAEKVLKRLLAAIDNIISKKQVVDNQFSFGIKEYIEIPDIEYQRDIGIIGLNVTIAFARRGKRIERKKSKRGRLAKKQIVNKEEIIDYIKENLGVEVK